MAGICLRFAYLIVRKSCDRQLMLSFALLAEVIAHVSSTLLAFLDIDGWQVEICMQ